MSRRKAGAGLIQIVDSTEDVFDFWEDLMYPVDELVLLAIIL